MKILNLKTIFFLFFVAGSYFTNGQNLTITIEYTEQAKLVINQTVFTNKTSVTELTKLIGEPSRKVDYASGETSYFYDEIGIVFFTKTGIVKGLGINYNWDGDKKFPEQAFTGRLKLAEVDINKNTNSETIAGIKGIEFICPIPIMCANKDREASANCLVAFTDNLITQVAFVIN